MFKRYKKLATYLLRKPAVTGRSSVATFLGKLSRPPIKDRVIDRLSDISIPPIDICVKFQVILHSQLLFFYLK